MRVEVCPSHRRVIGFAPKMPNGSQMTEAELDHIASGIRPSWELDDAPFRPGGLASPELEALLAGGAAHANGIAHSHTNGAGPFTNPITAQRAVALNVEPEDMLTRVDPVPPAPILEDAPIAPVRVEARVEARVDAAPAAPLPVPQFTAQAVAQPPVVVAPSTRPAPVQIAPSQLPASKGVALSAQADPFAAPVARPKAARAKATSSADFPAIKKSNKGLFIGLGGGAVAIVVAVIVFVSSSGSSAKDATKISASPTASQMPGTSTTHEIPPPPAVADLPAATAAATQAAVPATATATQIADLPAATTAPVTPPPPATHVAHNDSPPPQATHHAASPPHSNPPPSSGGSGKGKGGIVRDVPF